MTQRKEERQDTRPDNDVIEFDRDRPKGEAADPSAPQTGETVSAERLSRLQAEKDELMQTLVRRQADFDNYRKRIERERNEDRRHGAGRLIEDLLPVLDALERGLKAHSDPAYEEYRKGLELIYKQLWDMLARHGLERILATGKPFDPHYHQAVERVETEDYPEGTVLDVLQDGFVFHGRVIRPSMVRVSCGGSHSETSKSSGQRHNS